MYIAFEGIEGSGKSLQIKLLENFLKERKVNYLIVREPGSTEIGKEIRKILLNENFSQMNNFTEIFLYLADRAEHFNKIIKPNLNKYDFIISDRSYFSTLVYQGFGRNINLQLLKQLNKLVIHNIELDFIFLFDIPIEIGVKRALQRNAKKSTNESRFEKEDLEFHKKIREGYLHFANKEKNWFIIDASQSVENINKIIINTFLKWI